jgi:hypothetical protein
VERVELTEHLAGQETEQPAHLRAGDLRADREAQPGRRLLGGELVDHRGDRHPEAVGVRLHPAGAVDHQHRGVVLGRHQPGEVAHQPGGAVGVGAQLVDDGVGLLALDLRALAGEP